VLKSSKKRSKSKVMTWCDHSPCRIFPGGDGVAGPDQTDGRLASIFRGPHHPRPAWRKRFPLPCRLSGAGREMAVGRPEFPRTMPSVHPKGIIKANLFHKRSGGHDMIRGKKTFPDRIIKRDFHRRLLERPAGTGKP